MTVANDNELVEYWGHKPAPLLPLLHAFHDRDGYLSDQAIKAVSAGLGIPLAELYGTVTFYHHFSRSPGGLNAPRVCTGPVCCLRGGEALLRSIRSSDPAATGMPCAGRCDDPVPVLTGREVRVGVEADDLRADPAPLPAPNPGGLEECVFASIREPGRAGMEGYRRTGGYQALERAIAEMTPGEVVERVTASKLAGRGGAAFPTGVKWKAVADAAGRPKSVVANADEGEPGCFKDRTIMDYDPHALIEGMILAGYASGAARGFIYLRYEYPETAAILDRAISEAESAGYLGRDIGGRGFDFEIHVRRGAGAYICGEEGSLLNSLEGKHPFPRNRPPFPVTHGFENLPTAVNNVETLASVPPIVRRGSDWYRGLGRNGHAGTKVISLSGDIRKPGNYEVPIGFPLRELLDEWGGGPVAGGRIQAVTMAGLSGGFLAGNDLDVTLDDASIKPRGSFLGAGGIMVFDDRRDMVDVARMAMAFFAEESCGKCFPCRIGTQRLTERLSGGGGPSDLEAWLSEVEDIGDAMRATSACGLGMAAPHVTGSLVRYFPDQIKHHLQTKNPV